MTKEDAVKELILLQAGHDIEEGHFRADNILCDLLNQLGYDDVVKEYHKVKKWFA